MGEHVAEVPGGVEAVAVVVPAHDEEELIGRCLASVAAATAELRGAYPAVAASTLVVLDRCSDGSAAAAARAGVSTLPSAAGSVGAARREGVRAAVARLGPVRAGRVWIACTDADTVVPPRWLVHQVEAAAAGAGLVLGPVVPDERDLDPATYAAWLDRHRTPASPAAVHGANLGVRLDAYEAVGGFTAADEHEDVLLVAALRARGTPERAGLTALTSGRRRGRVVRGFSGYLRDLEAAHGYGRRPRV